MSTIRFICLTPLLCAVSAFPQALASIHCDSQLPSDTIRQTRKKQTFLSPSFNAFKYIGEAATTLEQATGALNALSPVQKPSVSKPADFNQDIYYRNKLEFSLDGGWLPINIPFPLDIFVGDAYNTYPLKYTLVPIIASLRWQLDSVGGPWILRGNWDMTFSGSITAIPRGPESRYFSYDMGIRRNFVRRNWKVAPYFDVRLGVGNIDAKGPLGVKYAQGEDLTFTVNMGSGLRYNLNPRYALSAGMNFMHISNLDLSEGGPAKGVWNYGINVYGPMVGMNIRLGKPKQGLGQQHLDMR